MADRRGAVVPLIIILFILLSPSPARGPLPSIEYHRAFEENIAKERHSLEVLNNSSYIPQRFGAGKSFGLNLTGLEQDRGYAWSSLRAVQEEAKHRLEHALHDEAPDALQLEREKLDKAPLYRNISGFVQGKWTRSKLDEGVAIPALNLSEYTVESPFGIISSDYFERNITGAGGEAWVRLRELDARRLSIPASIAGLTQNVTEIEAEISFSDPKTYEEHGARLLGVYFPSAGLAVLSTTSEKFDGVFMLPHLTLSETMFNTSRSLLSRSIARVIDRQANGSINSFHPWSSQIDAGIESPFTNLECELIVYLQQQPPLVTPASPSRDAYLHFLESELQSPTGAFVPSAPPVQFSMLAFSPDCGYVLESQGPPDFAVQDGDHLIGLKAEVTYQSGRHHVLIFNLALALQLVLLVRQMREANTPSTRSRISFYTIAMLAFGDGFTTMTFLLTSVFVDELWINLIGTAFLSFISVSFFGMRLLMDIWAVQAPERIRRAREQAEEDRARFERAQEAIRQLRVIRERMNATNGTSGFVEMAPLPPIERLAPDALPTISEAPEAPSEAIARQATAPSNEPPIMTVDDTLPQAPALASPADTGATPVFMPSDQEALEPADIEAAARIQAGIAFQGNPSLPNFGSLYTRFYLLLLGTLFLTLNAASWPAPIRRIYFTSVTLIYLSFWIPQLRRNVQRNCRRALNWEYVFGQSILRLVPFVYFYAYSENVLFVEQDLTSLALMACWLWIQVMLLVSQEIIGPRWFIRNDWAPPAYDYHPVLREDEEASNMPIGYSQATAVDSSPPSPTTERRGSTVSIKDVRERPGRRIFDCAICMQDLEVPVVSSDSSLGAGMLSRRTYMVPPCRHIFHSTCLEGWMKYRLQCPICRETLPPL